MHDLAVLFEHPQWQEPLFAALAARGIDFVAVDLKQAAYASSDEPMASVVFNQASPSAYVRGHERSVPQNLALMRQLEYLGVDVINGSRAFSLELSKAAQVALSRRLKIDHPHSIVFNDVDAAIAALRKVPNAFPRLLKPDLGGSGARIQVVDDEEQMRAAFTNPAIWPPDYLFLAQEYLPHDPDFGIVRLEIVDGKLLYAMRVVTHGRFNLCPSPVCNPDDGDGACEIPVANTKPVEFYPFPEVPAEAVETALTLIREGGIDVGGVEYLQTPDGRRVFYDINANSNLRPSVAAATGVDPFARVVDFLERRIAASKAKR